MKILVISHMFPTLNNKMNGIFVYHRVQKLVENGVKCQVISPQPKYFWMLRFFSHRWLNLYGGIPESFEINNIEVLSPKYLYIPMSYFRDRIGKLISQTVLKYSEGLNLDENFIIHAHFATHAGIAAMKLSEKFHMPYIVTAHGSDINCSIGNKIREKYLFQVLSNATKVIFVSNALREKSKELKGYDTENSVVIPNGVDTNLFDLKDRNSLRENLGIKKDSKVILFVGNLLEVKGVQFLPYILKEVREKIEAVLFIVGDGPMKKKMIDDAKKLNVLKYFNFVGRRSQEEVAKYMNAANVLILPSVNEGFPNVINESLACGTPVVGSETGGIPEALGGKEYGALFPVGNVEKAAEAIVRVLSKSWDREKLREKAVKLSWENTVSEEIKVYKEVIKNSGPNGSKTS